MSMTQSDIDTDWIAAVDLLNFFFHLRISVLSTEFEVVCARSIQLPQGTT